MVSPARGDIAVPPGTVGHCFFDIYILLIDGEAPTITSPQNGQPIRISLIAPPGMDERAEFKPALDRHAADARRKYRIPDERRCEFVYTLDPALHNRPDIVNDAYGDPYAEIAFFRGADPQDPQKIMSAHRHNIANNE